MKYKITMKKNDYFRVHNRLKARNLEFYDDQAKFMLDKESLSLLKKSGYHHEVESFYKKKIIDKIKRYYLLIIGVAFLIVVIYLNSYRVTDITFSEESPINDEIEKEISKDYRYFLNLKFFTKNIVEFENKIKRQYLDYPYLSVKKVNNQIVVTIKSIEYQEKTCIDVKGNIIAKEDSIIYSSLAYYGQLQVKKNMFVRKGDVLIEDSGTGVAGQIMGYTYNKVTFDVPKSCKIETLTNNKEEYNSIILFGNEFFIGKKNNYEKQNVEQRVCFNFFDFFCIKKIVEEEKNDIIKKINSVEEAFLLAKEKYFNYFDSKKVNDEEKIIDIKLYNSSVNTDSYKIDLVVKALESIGELK